MFEIAIVLLSGSIGFIAFSALRRIVDKALWSFDNGFVRVLETKLF